MTDVIDGNALADEIFDGVAAAVDEFEAEGVTPGLATVIMGEDPASQTYVNMKHRDCEQVGVNGIHVEVDGDASQDELVATVEDLNDREDVHAILVQTPLPDHVDEREVMNAIDPMKDADGFHPENVGRLVAGEARFKPCTPHGVQRMLAHAGVETEGADVVIVGRSNIVGKPLANLLVQKADDGNATVTVCHSRTNDLEAKTKAADVVVAAAGVPEFVTGDMLTDGTAVIDVGINRVDADTEKGYELVGDVEFESASEKASVISPVPGGVGPMTRAMLQYNTVKATRLQTGIDATLP
ncbi:bifunctional 5,10-methylene-tetrahydrofolate dehydrogenase/5,10-methylene-tetrahydrofolate cyclohydrolase [Halorubellus sp. JP-L1]|uniref:tetrahydrofolate dehydrogenase/cyclohydrolase catalytic domain-containing protein n=1 Tax=Halorubellus sp. JP-L1 TaxID=2715753 RepID=UPI00140DA13F|nr:tetrahydrofolate dehydrogenase/cyclohydrolase catalytic domain-containing protein [Halorubellus sp. JP-L1]NHN40679.1 bifunctional 5,10-methylene-tetrahydrofolate dehydrogenase/5,10-methylene-tetrahydrofolate cyclohydrolase [Halorubellus sp. JP-L1]